MLPVLLKIGPFTIYSYGFFLALAIFFGSFIIWREARKQGYPEEKILDLILVTFLSGLVGSRLFHTFFVGPVTLDNLLRFWQFDGLFFGGLIMGALAFLYLCKKNGWSLFEVGDMLVLGLSLAQALGSLGCFLSGCQQPTAIFETLFYLALFVSLLYLPRGKKLFPGFLLFLYLASFSAFRLLIEAFRHQSLFINYVFSLALLIFSVLNFYKRRANYYAETAEGFLKRRRLEVIPRKRIARTWREISMQKKIPTSLLKEIKQRLLRRKEKIKHEQLLLEQEDPFAQAGRTEDNAELISDTEEQIGHERIEVAKRSLKRSMTSIKRALLRIGKGKYGVCENCGCSIDKARLEAIPTASLCFECARKKESSESAESPPPTVRIS